VDVNDVADPGVQHGYAHRTVGVEDATCAMSPLSRTRCAEARS
jgi:hypothetical protein